MLSSSKANGKAVRDACSVGCIGCGICAKNCECGAITVENFLATIDPLKCTACGVCAEKCPRHIIKIRDGFEMPEIAIARKANIG